MLMENEKLHNNADALSKSNFGNFYLMSAGIFGLLHFIFLFIFFEKVCTGPDAHGYYVQTRLIAESRQTWFTPENPLQYIGPHWLKIDEDRWVSRYPPGLPLLLAIPYKIFGPTAVFLMNPIFTSITLLGTFGLCRLWMGEKWGLAAMIVMAVNPIANSWTFMGDAHPASACFLIWGLLFLIQWSRNQRPVTGLPAGILLGVIPTIRYAEVWFAPAILLYLIKLKTVKNLSFISFLPVLLGAGFPTLCLLIHNQIVLGAFGKTGYDLGSALFSWKYFLQKIFPYLHIIQTDGIGVFVALGLSGMLILYHRKETRPEGFLLLGLILPITLFYTSYFFFDRSLRFLLPTFYLYGIAGIWFLKILTENRPKEACIITITFVGLTVIWGIPLSLERLFPIKASNRSIHEVALTVLNQVDKGAVIIAPEPIQQHLDCLGYWRTADESYFSNSANQEMHPPGLRKDDPANRILAQLMQQPEKQKIREKYTNAQGEGWSEVLIQDLKTWALPDRMIYWLGNVDKIKRAVPQTINLEVVMESVSSASDHRMPPMPEASDDSGKEPPPGIEMPAKREPLALVKLVFSHP